MAMNTESTDLNGLKVQEESGGLQIIEETSNSEEDSEDENKVESRLSSCSPNVSKDLVPSSAHVFGSVSVAHSENIHFGDKHIRIFNGPVSIKQIVQPSSGIDNVSYIKTEDEKDLNNSNTNSEAVNNSHKKTDEDFSIKKLQRQLWCKLILSVIGVALIGGICAVVFFTQSGNHQDIPVGNEKSDNFSNTDLPSNPTKVVCSSHTEILVISIILMPLTILLLYRTLLLTNGMLIRNDDTKTVVTKTINNVPPKPNKLGKGYEDGLLIAPNHLRMVSRPDWLAQPPAGELDKIRQPVPWVIITHTATESCFKQSSCVLAVRFMQTFHIESRGWYDIGYNFLVGGDGSAYYARGWDYIGAHTKGYNKYSIGIGFIGTFNTETPPAHQVEACKKLIRQGVQEGKLAKDYKLFAHRQLMSTLSPGDKLYDIIKEWPHFVKNYSLDLIPNY